MLVRFCITIGLVIVSYKSYSKGPEGTYQPGRFQNRAFINKRDFANSPLGPTLSAKSANPDLYKNPVALAGPPPPPPPPPIPLDGGFIIVLLGSFIGGIKLFVNKITKRVKDV